MGLSGERWMFGRGVLACVGLGMAGTENAVLYLHTKTGRVLFWKFNGRGLSFSRLI